MTLLTKTMAQDKLDKVLCTIFIHAMTASVGLGASVVVSLFNMADTSFNPLTTLVICLGLTYVFKVHRLAQGVLGHLG